MKNGYDQFFSNARKVAQETPQKKSAPRFNVKMSDHSSTEEVEEQIRRRLKMTPKTRRKKKSAPPWGMITLSMVGFVLAIWGFQNYEEVESFLGKIEISMTGQANAQSTPPKAVSNSPAPSAAAAVPAAEVPTVASNIELDHLQKLNERKKELDAREAELNRLETELQAQKSELGKRLEELEQMRTSISSILEDRVKADEEKVETLVQMYSNMKAPQAAKVFETMDEDLAVEILGRMKKKNAADIMNLLKPEKAQTLSEMFAGYKRRSPASSR